MDKNGLLRTGQRVVRREAQALDKLAQALDQGFADAVELMLAARGRVIVSGMGKSGHIAHWHRPERPHISSIPPRPATATWA